MADARPLVLYVEDDADSFRVVAARLRSRYQFIWAKSDEEACQHVTLLGARLRGAVLDVELAGSKLDGLALSRLLRGLAPMSKLPAFAQAVRALPKTTPIVVLTAYTQQNSEAVAKAAGASHYCTKPIDFARLQQALDEPLMPMATSPSGEHPAAGKV